MRVKGRLPKFIPGPPPKWFTVLIRSMVKRRVTVSRTSTHKIKSTPHFNKLQLPELLDVENVQITTDGACKDGKMGSAAVFDITGQNEPIVVMTQPTKSNPSAELAAIYMALLIAHPHNRIILNYDCESAMNDIILFQTNRFTQRMKLKTSDYPLVQAIVILLEKFDHSVVFNKIPRAENCADGIKKIVKEISRSSI
jgi:ribonuclease HI